MPTSGNSGIRQLHVMAYTLCMHRSGLLSWYDHGLSTGPLEGINHKIGALQRPACGLHNFEHRTERLQSLHSEKGELEHSSLQIHAHRNQSESGSG